jgi:hypothetical protein
MQSWRTFVDESDADDAVLLSRLEAIEGVGELHKQLSDKRSCNFLLGLRPVLPQLLHGSLILGRDVDLPQVEAKIDRLQGLDEKVQNL